MIAWCVWLAGCTCQGDPPTETEDTSPPQSTAETGSTADTGPPPACPWPEVEPNGNLVDPAPIVLEQHACGTFGEPGDLDAYGFTLDVPTWLAVEAETPPGAFGNVFVALAAGTGWTTTRDDDTGATDVHLVFPAEADSYTLWLLEQNGSSGPDYAWDLLVSEAKPPATWSAEEIEPNDTQALATPVTSGGVWFGTMDGNGLLADEDWFTITLPPGKVTLTADVDAWADGSAVNLTAYTYASDGSPLPAGCTDCAVTGGPGPAGFDRDPLVELELTDGGTVAIRLLGVPDTHEGPPSWYILAIDVEAE